MFRNKLHQPGSLEELGDFLVKKKTHTNRMSPKTRKIQAQHAGTSSLTSPLTVLGILYPRTEKEQGQSCLQPLRSDPMYSSTPAPQPCPTQGGRQAEGVSGIIGNDVSAGTFLVAGDQTHLEK